MTKFSLAVSGILFSVGALGQGKVNGGTDNLVKPNLGIEVHTVVVDLPKFEEDFSFMIVADIKNDYQSRFYVICNLRWKEPKERSYLPGSFRSCQIGELNRPIFGLDLGPKVIGFNGLMYEFELTKKEQVLPLRKIQIKDLPPDVTLAVSMAPTEANMKRYAQVCSALDCTVGASNPSKIYNELRSVWLDLSQDHGSNGIALLFYHEVPKNYSWPEAMLYGQNRFEGKRREIIPIWYRLFESYPYNSDFEGRTSDFWVPPGQYIFQKCVGGSCQKHNRIDIQ